jgi:hypothetical protein
MARSATVRPPVTTISTALRAAVTHRAIAPVAVAVPGLSRILLHPRNRVITPGSSGRRESACSITSCQYAAAYGLAPAPRLSTRFRSPGGSAAGGPTPDSTAARSARRLLFSQASHRSTCCLTRSCVGAVSVVRRPSQSASKVSSASQASRPIRATRSAPRAPSNLPRARAARASTFFRGTPSTVATSAISRSCLRFSSMTSRSS